MLEAHLQDEVSACNHGGSAADWAIGEKVASLEIHFDSDGAIALNGAELDSDPYVLPSFAPVGRQHGADRSMAEDACCKIIVDAADRRMLSKELVHFFVLKGMLSNVPRLPPIHDEQRRERALPVRILPRPVLAPGLRRKVQPLGPDRGAGEQQRAEQQEAFHVEMRSIRN